MSDQQEDQQRQPAQQPQPPRPVYGPPPPGTPYSYPTQQAAPAAPPVQQAGQPFPVGPPEPRRGLSTGAIVGIVLGGVGLLVALLLVLGMGFFSYLMTARGETRPGPEALAGAEQAVEEYLGALADGDAAAAREYVWNLDSDALLTDEVLAASQDLAPITDVEVGEAEADGPDAVVPVSFKLGDETVERTFTVWTTGSGWQLYDGLTTVGFFQFEGLGLSLNGVPADDVYFEVFPGVYEIGIDDRHFEIPEGRSTVRIATLDDEDALYELQAEPTAETLETFRTLVRESLEECLAMTSLTTPCGLDADVDDRGDRVIDGTVKRELTPEGELQLTELEVEQLWDTPTALSAWGYIDIRITGSTASGDSEPITSSYLRYPIVDFGESTLKVVWEE